MDNLSIQFFLYLGYFPHYITSVPLDYEGIDRERYKSSPRGDLIKESGRLFRQVIAREYDSGQKPVVPLSGGLDSRAILCALLELTEAKNIRTYTFGTPGTYDYDLGCAVARRAGTSHTSFALNAVEWRLEDFEEAAQRFDHQTFLFHHAPMRFLERFADGVTWSGYIGDVVTGGHLRAEPSKSIEEAKKKYLQKRRETRSVDLITVSPEEFMPFIGGGAMDPSLRTYDEQVIFSELGVVTAPHVLMKGFQYKTPFINNEFYNFHMSIPDRFRQKQSLFIESMELMFPELFSIPTKSRYGLRLKASGAEIMIRRARNKLWNIGQNSFRSFNWPALPMTNFFDVNRALRRDANLRDIVYSALQDLKARGVVDWIDIDKIWARHMKRQKQHGDAIKILFSLEMNLRGKDKLRSQTAEP